MGHVSTCCKWLRSATEELLSQSNSLVVHHTCLTWAHTNSLLQIQGYFTCRQNDGLLVALCEGVLGKGIPPSQDRRVGYCRYPGIEGLACLLHSVTAGLELTAVARNPVATPSYHVLWHTCCRFRLALTPGRQKRARARHSTARAAANPM